MTQDRDIKVLNIVNFPDIHGAPVDMERQHPYYSIFLRGIACSLFDQLPSLEMICFGSSQIGVRPRWQCVEAVVCFAKETHTSHNGTIQRAVALQHHASLPAILERYTLPKNPKHAFTVHDWLSMEASAAELKEFYDDDPKDA